MSDFIGRVDELNKIYKAISDKRQSNVLLYGRIRVGKTRLIKEVLDNVDCHKIYYQCKNISEEAVVKQLTSIIKEEYGISRIAFSDLEDILDYLFSQNDLVFILDEYPFLQARVEGLDSIIQQKIDCYRDSSNMTFITSGSQLDLMSKLIEKSNPLYGRFDTVILLKEQNYLESSLYYPNFTNEEKVIAYSIFGGEPYYNSKVDDSISLVDNIINLAVVDNSLLEVNIVATIKNELAKISSATEVLTAIARGKTKNKDIADAANITSSSMDNVLKKLIDLEIVEKVKPINEKSERKSLYYIKNKAVRFYYRYIDMFVDSRLIIGPERFYHDLIEKDLLTKYVPNVFEDIAKQYLILLNLKGLNETTFYKIGSYWYDDKVNKKNGQFDVVTLDKNGYIFYEVKFIKNQVSTHILNEELEQLKQLSIPYYKLGFITKNGSNLDSSKYIIYDLNDLYNVDLLK